MMKPYVYRAVVRSVYDGDSIRVDIDFGFGIWQRNVSLRLAGINAPEIRGEERPQGIISRDWLRALLPEGKEIIIETIKDRKEKYGRYLAVIFLDSENINERMINEGYATPYT